MARRRKPKIEPEDLALWKRVADTVSPLKSRSFLASEAPKPDDALPEPVTPKADTAAPRPPTAPSYSPPPQTKTQGPRPANLDRKLKRRLDRGQRNAEAVIDLHGLTQRVAHDRLLAFLRSSQAQGLRVVLVVTGKGRAPVREHGDWWEPPAGILRRSVPHWLETLPFRDLVSAYEIPSGRRGGEGALYIQVKRRRESGRS